MTIVYDTRGRMLPAMSPKRPGTGQIAVEDVASSFNGGKPTAFDYGLLYEGNDPDYRALKSIRKTIIECLPDSGYMPRRAAICKSDVVEVLFDNFPTYREDHVGRTIRSSLYFKFKRDELKDGDLNAIAVLFMDAGLNEVRGIVDEIIPDNQTLIQFRTLPSNEKNKWLQDRFFKTLRGRKFSSNEGGDKLISVSNLLKGKFCGQVFAKGPTFVEKGSNDLSASSLPENADKKNQVPHFNPNPNPRPTPELTIRTEVKKPELPEKPSKGGNVRGVPPWVVPAAIAVVVGGIICYLIVKSVGCGSNQPDNKQYIEEKGK